MNELDSVHTSNTSSKVSDDRYYKSWQILLTYNGVHQASGVFSGKIVAADYAVLS